MAAIEELIKHIADPRLRQRIADEVAKLKAGKKFGLVFEEHLPEIARLPSLPIKAGARVVKKEDHANTLYRVLAQVNGRRVRIEPEAGGAAEVVERKSIIPVKTFGEPMYPALKLVDSIERAPDKPWHVLINADNFHALQLLLYGYEGKVDVIYIDPPYNTGARDWKYNNDYVEADDQFRHSKWLSMLKKRLILAQRLLNPADSVLIVTIDEKEYARLGLLLEDIFPNSRVQMISTLVNPANVARAGSFGRSDEYIYFVMMGAASPQRVSLDREWVSARGRTHTGNLRWDLLRRSGPGSSREDSPGCFYPIYIDPDGPRVARVGDAIQGNQSLLETTDGTVAVLPIRRNGSAGRWQWTPRTLRERLPQGRVRVGGSADDSFVIYVLKDGEYQKVLRGEFEILGNRPDGSIIEEGADANNIVAVPGNQWRISSHDATQYGSRLLAQFLPGRNFPFPKSLYAVEDGIRFFTKDKSQAIVLDFFAGSGTTTHAVARLNRQDGGRRRSILITNNEVSSEDERRLKEAGLEAGDPNWEARGIFEQITTHRITAAFTGETPEGNPVSGNYKFRDEFPMSDGFEENAAYFKLDFLDPGEVARGDSFEAIVPILWMFAGCIGPCQLARGAAPWFMPEKNPFAVLIREVQFEAFHEKLRTREDITHVFLVTDSTESFEEMAGDLGERYRCIQLYRSYLDTFKINLAETANGKEAASAV